MKSVHPTFEHTVSILLHTVFQKAVIWHSSIFEDIYYRCAQPFHKISKTIGFTHILFCPDTDFATFPHSKMFSSSIAAGFSPQDFNFQKNSVQACQGI